MMAEKTDREFTGRHMLIIMLAFFGVVITANLVMAFFASDSWTGLVVKNSYVESQKFNSYLDEAEKQKALGWNSDLTEKDGIVAFSLRDNSGNLLSGLEIRAIAERPAHANDDRVIIFRQSSDGAYIAGAGLPAGAWNIRIVATGTSKQTYRQNYQIVVRKE